MSQGAAVLGLLERAKVPPSPPFYRLLYDYVAGVEGLFSRRVDDILAHPDAGERLYAEFVQPYEPGESMERAIARITERLRTLDLMIVQSAEASHAQKQSLREAAVGLQSETLNAKLLGEWVGRLQRANSRLTQANDRLGRELVDAQAELDGTRNELRRSKESARRDPLTGLANRAGIDVQLSQCLAASAEDGRTLVCGVIDIDHFKSLNDRYGHLVGDEVLRVVGRALLASGRSDDIIGRTGGDEFVYIFVGTDLAAAEGLANRIRQAILDADLRGLLGQGVLGGVSASIGLAPSHPGDSIAALFERADRALYAAKADGRNRVVCAEGDQLAAIDASVAAAG